ncbi:MAG TPA: DGQHR domain-containing protein [Methylococcus sp.]|nr:DGQHR domain-containing protein [Methylococcus sp.]
MSGEGGATLIINPDSERRLTSQIDVVAIDDEVCVAVECKSLASRSRRPNLQQELAKHGLTREALARAMKEKGGAKRSIVLGLWTHNAILSATDRERAREQNVALLDTEDLEYYETLTRHLGPAARHQFLADLTPGRPIPGLAIRVPALESRMGGYRSYTFAISPEYLLKIAYVSHRARGKRSDIASYQRMVSRSRLRRITRYISEPDSIFPTNIVINLDPGKKGSGAHFEKAKQEAGREGATYGWLTLRPTYKSAWVIDGQHRLFAYSGHPKAATSQLSVLAFEGLPGSMQQQLFIDINAEQKSVKRSLLQELYADLHRNSEDPRKLIQALISEAVQELGRDADSPLFDRILLADSVRTETRCISLNSLFSALDKPGFYYGSVKNNLVVNPGPFWSDRADQVVKRTNAVLNAWFSAIEARAADWWAAGAGEGGGLAMNDGVTVAIMTLRSVVEHLDQGRTRLADLPPAEVIARLEPYAECLGDYFGAMSQEQRVAFRSLRGVQGQTAGMRHAQAALQERFPEFRPDGLEDFLEREKARTNDQAMSLIGDIERLLNKIVVGVLRAQFGEGDDRWWYDGVPKAVRTPVSQRQEEDNNQRGSKDAYFDLIHYRQIAIANWTLFSDLLSDTKTGSKERRTAWIARINEIRKVAAHSSSGASVSFEELSELQNYLEWIEQRAEQPLAEDADRSLDDS